MISWQAIIMMLEDGHERAMLLMKHLLQFFSKTNIVKPGQIINVSTIFVHNTNYNICNFELCRNLKLCYFSMNIWLSLRVVPKKG